MILRYRGLFELFSNHIQQMVKESIDKQLDLDGNVINRKVGLYFSLGNVNAFHKPWVKAEKKAASGVIEMLSSLHEYLTQNTNHSFATSQVSSAIGEVADVQTMVNRGEHLSVNHERRP